MSLFSRLSLKTKVVLVLLATTLLVYLAEGAVRNRHLLRCMTVGWSSLRQAGPGVHVDDAFSPERRISLQSEVQDAVGRVERFFGERRASPTLILCANPESLERYAGTTKKTILTYRTPFGDYIVAAEPTLSALFLSHELTHAELDKRLGWRRAMWQVPMWFQEGLAMVASGDTRYDEVRLREAVLKSGLNPELKQLESWRDFNRLAAQNGDLAYGMAFKEVSLWYRRVGREGLDRLLTELSAGKPFEEVYAEVERAAPARR